ncbi:ABC transporter ATP-binding protein [Adlercreutzia agrestimuris]|uniref:ABC transporter ATP-binding protein n=1 Tax=Adlercreutzia agrestimuris TaxID=2941324 RepID=UPI00203EA287|nr:ABC transporter ATP-binding protein [Adlercreutzia agrestimuris]
MPEVVNTSFLESTLDVAADEQRETVIGINNVSMVFNMASQQLNSLKEYAIALARHELRFKEFRALDNISFDIKRGDVFGILGTNGSGKSTLLKIIAGVLEPTEGSCTINGTIAPLIELGAGFDMELTARENIYLNGALLGYTHDYLDEHFDEIVDFAEVEQFLDMPMKNYSSGMVARVAFAVATVVVPDILIVDEVLSVGDFMFQQKCERKIESLIKDHQVTVLIVSHSNAQIARLCNKAVWIEKGHMRTIGDVESVCSLYRILGGHEGSPESEALVYDALKLPSVEAGEDITQTIVGEDRFGSAVKLREASSIPTQMPTIVVAPGTNDALCMLANHVSATMKAPLYLVRPDAIPDITAHALKQEAPQRVIVIGNENEISPVIESELAELLNDAQFVRISGDTPHDVALNAYEQLDGWGSCAVVTWAGCSADTISCMPVTLRKQAALFYVPRGGGLDEQLKTVLEAGAFDEIIVLGGEPTLPTTDLEALPIARKKRFCAPNPSEANRVINEWVDDELDTAAAQLIMVSAADPADAFAVGQYVLSDHSRVLFENAGDLDSIANAIRMIDNRKGADLTLTFIGSHVLFDETDKTLLAKVMKAR